MMRIRDDVALVGSGDIAGFSLTDPYDCSIYLLDGGDELALIDAGSGEDVDELIAQVRAAGCRPERIRYVFLTHAHFDHAGGCRALRDRLGVQVVALAEAARRVRTADTEATAFAAAQRAGMYPAHLRCEPCPVDRVVVDGETLAVGRLRLTALATPGHSADHCAYLLAGQAPALFSGDCVLAGGRVIIQHIADCLLEDYARSIRKLAAQDFTALLPGHGLFALNRGRRHLDVAVAALDQLLMPGNLVT